ncbi:hypothetical protein L1987_47990 [Smallanthus sonchifolius]|uniref:Uncharacterized protein n=1 Tax=Smallanthus sonchifolius TaxID=185202 RepID=A0ACB9FRL8_9ASTR|nr:hypothetical protein L1987_47990 [Smallanthus sonchifolius]
MNDDDNWVKSAMDDTALVVHVILKLRQPSPFPPPKTWTIRQRRSRPPPPPPVAKKSSVTRASPTTPLSWSGATSVSVGGAEESSRPVHDASDITRSKVIRTNETTPTKRPRKKKTLAELKEDETTLLKERKQLKRQLATLQATCQKERKENERLKKMKNDMKSQQVLAVSDCTEEQNNSFVLPDLNIPAGEDC